MAVAASLVERVARFVSPLTAVTIIIPSTQCAGRYPVLSRSTVQSSQLHPELSGLARLLLAVATLGLHANQAKS